MFRSIFVIALTCLLASCSTHYSSIEDLAPVDVQIAFSGFDISNSVMTRTGETTTTIPTGINRLALKVFNTQGAEVASITQKGEAPSEAVTTGVASLGSSPTFCGVSFRLVPGDYTFVCILNEAQAENSEALAAIAPATISSSTVATIPGTDVHDTYCCSQSVTIAQSTTSVNLTMGSRVNARFTLNVTDTQIPAEVKCVAFTISPEASDPTESIELNPSTGFSTSSFKVSKSQVIENGASTVPNLTVDLYLPASSYTTDIRIEARDAATSGNPISAYTRTLSNVPFSKNKHITATGHLFDPTSSFTFTFVTDPWTETELPF